MEYRPMIKTDTTLFYSSLPIHTQSVNQVLADASLFHEVPEDWHIVLTDIKNSTAAVRAGQHQLVNLIAAGSIIAALNICRNTEINIPFFFGGDGATLLVPPSILEQTTKTLYEHSRNAFNNFNLQLRVGDMPVAEVYKNKYKLKIAKVRIRKPFSIPVLKGNGLVFAEDVIKAEENMPVFNEGYLGILNLEGMECRWDRIKPPEDLNEVVSLLVTTKSSKNQAKIYKKVLDYIDEIYGPQTKREPITIQRLKLKASLIMIAIEGKTKMGELDLWYMFKNWLFTLFGKLYIRFYQKGQHYLQQLVQLSDTLVMDGRINTVMSGTPQQRKKLMKALDKMEAKGDIIYGLSVSEESVISCYVRNRDDQHIHFVDGAEGGYTRAAKVLKKKLRG